MEKLFNLDDNSPAIKKSRFKVRELSDEELENLDYIEKIWEILAKYPFYLTQASKYTPINPMSPDYDKRIKGISWFARNYVVSAKKILTGHRKGQYRISCESEAELIDLSERFHQFIIEKEIGIDDYELGYWILYIKGLKK